MAETSCWGKDLCAGGSRQELSEHGDQCRGLRRLPAQFYNHFCSSDLTNSNCVNLGLDEGRMIGLRRDTVGHNGPIKCFVVTGAQLVLRRALALSLQESLVLVELKVMDHLSGLLCLLSGQTWAEQILLDSVSRERTGQVSGWSDLFLPQYLLQHQ